MLILFQNSEFGDSTFILNDVKPIQSDNKASIVVKHGYFVYFDIFSN